MLTIRMKNGILKNYLEKERETMDVLVLIILLFVLLKPIFNLGALSVCYLYFLSQANKKNTSSAPLYPPPNPSTSKVRKLVVRYVSGLIFYAILQTGKISFHSVRNFIYKYIFRVKMAENVVVYGGVEMRRPDRLFIGKGSIIGHNCICDARNIIEIGENVNIANDTWLWSAQHNHRSQKFESRFSKNMKIVIQDRVYLGPGVIVLPGCTVGEGAVVGAGSIVTKDIEPFTINAGVPAKKIGERNRDIDYVFDGKALPFV